MRRLALRWIAVALGLGLLVGGVTAAVASQSDGGPGTRATDFGPDGPGPSDRPDPALSGQPVPTLPPGDPGADAPGTDDPDDARDSEDSGDSGEGAAGHDPDGHAADGDGGHGDGLAADEGRLTEVPGTSLVDAETVGAVAGGTWSTANASTAERCVVTASSLGSAQRSQVLAADDGSGRLVQVVGTWKTAKDASRAVDVIGGQLTGCGLTGTGDPRLGEASAAFDDGAGGHAVVIALEGATVVVAGTGTAAVPGSWESLTDLAMGSLCAAGIDGCH